jgi:two-component system CheB/CheR fusion protein
MNDQNEARTSATPDSASPSEGGSPRAFSTPAASNVVPPPQADGGVEAAADDAALESLLEYLKRSRGFDFTGYKRPSLRRRIDKRMRAVGIRAYGEYADFLEVHPAEFSQLFNVILINVTKFFRDDGAWEFLGAEVIPRILETRRPEAPIRVWVAGCSTGEEAYSAAMLLLEGMGEEAFRSRVKIYATDVDEDALNVARHGTYDERQLQGVSEERRARFFEEHGDRYAFRKELRRCVIFGRHDLVQDAPISRVDLLVCRNVLMYFNGEAQGRILSNFYFALAATGFLFLGKAEMLLTRSDLFTPLDLKHRVFTRVPQANLRERLTFLAHQDPAEPPDEALSPAWRLRERAFASGSSPQLVVDFAGYLVEINDQAKLLFRLEARDVGRPLHDLEVSYRPADLRSALDRAYEIRRAVVLKDVEWQAPGSERRLFEVQVAPLYDGRSTQPVGASITCHDRTPIAQLEHELRSAQQELETAYEEVESTNEELETTNEELQSTVEELETTNEELQSTNEELETINEELHSTNEELQAMNEELRRRSDELNEVNAFLESIYGNLKSAVVVLDSHLNVRVWNARATDIWGLRGEEAEGLPLTALDVGLSLQPLTQPVRDALAGRSPRQEVVLDGRDRRGRPLRCRVTIGPLLGSTGERRGVILFIAEDAPLGAGG